MSFLLSILWLIASLFSIIGILIISTVVYFAEEEVQLLFEIPEVDSRVFRLELREQTVIIPFIV